MEKVKPKEEVKINSALVIEDGNFKIVMESATEKISDLIAKAKGLKSFFKENGVINNTKDVSYIR